MENSFKIERINSDFMNNILGEKFLVLDNGFIRVIDYLGDDSSIVQAARVSCGKGTKKSLEDEELIHYLIRHHHLTPLEMCEIKLHVRVPMDCWRQWIRHRQSSTNERSSRYSIIDDGSQKTNSGQWRKQAKINKQGSGDYFEKDIGNYFTAQEEILHKDALKIYLDRIEKGMAREQARKDLPLSTYTEAYWKIDLRNLFNFLFLRMDSHAQFEIRQYANIIGNEIIANWVPVAWKAFKSYQINSLTLSSKELEILNSDSKERIKKAIEFNWLPENYNVEEKPPFNLEMKEFEDKLEKIGLSENFIFEK